MDKKIISLCFLLIIVIAITVTYIASNQPSSEKNQQNYVPGDVTDKDMSDGIGDFFILEGDEIEIGEMV